MFLTAVAQRLQRILEITEIDHVFLRTLESLRLKNFIHLKVECFEDHVMELRIRYSNNYFALRVPLFKIPDGFRRFA